MSNDAATKTYGIGAILSVTGDALMCDLGDLYGILGWLTGEDLMTHQLPRASREAEDFLREQFPDLASIEVPVWIDTPGWGGMDNDQKRGVIEAWLIRLGDVIGHTREVPRLPEQDHTHIDPLAELRMIRPDAPIITIEHP
jgi:hypothetical protein